MLICVPHTSLSARKAKRWKNGVLASSRVRLYLGMMRSPIAQGEISMSVAFPTHVWKMANICKHIIVWLFSHMCAFSHTYVSKSKHVWKKAPRCKYTNVFGFFQTCWVKVKHLPKCNFTHRFGFFLTYLQKQTCKEKTNMFSLNTTILFFLWEMKIL